MRSSVAGPALAAVVLERGSRLAGLVGAAGLAVRAAATLEEFARLVEAGGVDVAVVDPELDEAWPADVAAAAGRAAAGRAAGAMPLLLVCRSGSDATLAATRAPAATVLAREDATPDRIGAVLRGEVARGRPRAPGRAGG